MAQLWVDATAAAALVAEVPQARFVACDVTDIPALRAAIAGVGEVEVLVNNAARDDRHTLEWSSRSPGAAPWR